MDLLSKIGASLITCPIEQDLLASFIADKPSPRTGREYLKALKDFFRFLGGTEPVPALVQEFLGLSQIQAVVLVKQYKQHLYERGLTPATVNHRLSAIKSLVNHARGLGQCGFTLTPVKNDPATRYRDTTGISVAQFQALIRQVDGESVAGKRDLAILRLLWENALRRAEVAQLNVEDFREAPREAGVPGLWIRGKGQREPECVSITPKMVESLEEWLAVRTDVISGASPLFIALDPYSYGKRLTANAIYGRVRRLAELAGIPKRVSPQRLRHSSITQALDKTNGDIRSVQKLSRHKDFNTLLIYDDHRRNVQGKVSQLLSDDF